MTRIVRSLRLVVLLSAAAVSVPTASSAATIELTSLAASGVLDGNADVDPFPGLLYSELGTGGPGSVWLSVLKFDLSSLAGWIVDSAVLELTSHFNHSGVSFAHQMFSSTDDSWTEATLSGINRPADPTLALLSSTNIDGTSQAYSWNVLSGVVGAAGLAGANDLLTFLIRPDLSQAGQVFGPHFFDRGSAVGFPRLIVEAHRPAVPEPAVWLLLGTGLATVLRRRHNSRRG
jgi:hypothetical protein